MAWGSPWDWAPAAWAAPPGPAPAHPPPSCRVRVQPCPASQPQGWAVADCALVLLHDEMPHNTQAPPTAMRPCARLTVLLLRSGHLHCTMWFLASVISHILHCIGLNLMQALLSMQ